ncbi:MAG: hypothetical protein GEU80_09305 [Dehalococcoidia bacterium]|nr:hypothetical protein [Dehalococcoidia bacterium]
MSFEPGHDPEAAQESVLGPLVRVIEEAADDALWALIGSASVRLQGVDAPSPNLEFMTTERVLETLGEMLDLPAAWGRGAHLASRRLHFMRHGCPVFVFGEPVFHGPYESLSPREIPSLWDARVRVERAGVGVLCTPLEWELVLAVVLGSEARVTLLGQRMRDQGYDSRLIVRLLREGHVAPETEDSVWAILERE